MKKFLFVRVLARRQAFVFLSLMLCSWAVFGQNYGNFSASGGTGNVSLGTWPGWLNTSPYTRLGIYTSNQNGMEINVQGSNFTGLNVSASGSGSKALQVIGQTDLRETTIYSTLGIGITNSNMASHEKLAVRNGMITTDGIGNGISLVGSHLGSGNNFGTPWYGLFAGNPAQFSLSISQNTTEKPMIFSGFYGLGFSVGNGRMAFCQNGALVLSADDSSIKDIAGLNTWELGDYRLFVEKGIRTERARVDLKSNWADYVFENDYDLPELGTVEKFISVNKHLPNVPSAKEVKENGIDVAEMDEILLRKIEELTLYAITQEKLIQSTNVELTELKKQLAELQKSLNSSNK